MYRLVTWSLTLRPDAVALVLWSDEDCTYLLPTRTATRATLLLFLGILAPGILVTQVLWLMPGAHQDWEEPRLIRGWLLEPARMLRPCSVRDRSRGFPA